LHLVSEESSITVRDLASVDVEDEGEDALRLAMHAASRAPPRDLKDPVAGAGAGTRL
jgi:hypothetical protein